jgi:hypothetical protein
MFIAPASLVVGRSHRRRGRLQILGDEGAIVAVYSLPDLRYDYAAALSVPALLGQQ